MPLFNIDNLMLPFGTEMIVKSTGEYIKPPKDGKPDGTATLSPEFNLNGKFYVIVTPNSCMSVVSLK